MGLIHDSPRNSRDGLPMTSRRALFALLLIGLLPSVPTQACSIPVFRYALERWRPDAYEAVLFHRGPLSAEAQALVAELRQAGRGRINLKTLTIDLAGPVAEPWQHLWQKQGDVALPWLVVRYPKGVDIASWVWAGAPSREVLGVLTGSPSRHEIVRRLLAGESAVWLLLESGDPKKDDAAGALLQSELRRLEKELKLPDAETSPLSPKEKGKEDAESVKSLSDLPVRIAFSMVRVSRDDPEEKMLVAMLLRAHPDLREITEPVLYPVFGQGRALEAFVGREINAGTIAAAATFLCGACSCNVKGLNPGVDLLFAADWDQIFKDGARPPTEAPRKAGVSVPIPTARSKATPVAEPEQDRGSLRRQWMLAAIAAAFVLTVATGAYALIVSRKRRISSI